MNNTTHASAYPMGAGIESRTMIFYLGISLVIHLIFIGSVAFMPESSNRPRLGQGAINVSLVSLPGPPQAAPGTVVSPAPAPIPGPAAKTVAVPPKKVKQTPKAPVIETPTPKPKPVASKPAKTVSLDAEPQKPRVKRSLKKRTQNRQKMINQALAGVQKKVEHSQSQSVQQALDRLKKKVAQSEADSSRPGQAVAKMPGAGTGDAPAAGAAGSGSGGKQMLEIIDLYRYEVAFQVERHWAVPQQVTADGVGSMGRIRFRVLPSGEITDITITQRSGNSYLDDSVYKAILKANPVSPHPAAVKVPYVTVGVKFTPEGLRK
ncbi:hypothetical protein D1AOALGA4SA_2001 [Olavius algarvensis Delta 1 endosymbiont]|nr:hypothetical protein D1AOALGA4SA_2001 [Olavius algarvensis Delta 1 endosymbiont]